MKSKRLKNQKGITLVALVVTIIVLIILAGIAISMTVGENGIFTKAKEAKRLQITAEAKEKIGTEILAAQVEAIERNEELEQAQVEDIVSKYGTLQDDKDTIVLNDSEYTVSLLEIYQGTITSSGSYTENKAKIELLEGQVKRLQEQLESSSQTGDEKDKKIAELNEKITTVENEKAVLQSENNSLSSKVDEVTEKVKTIEQQISSMNSQLKQQKYFGATGTQKDVSVASGTPTSLGFSITLPAGKYILYPIIDFKYNEDYTRISIIRRFFAYSADNGKNWAVRELESSAIWKVEEGAFTYETNQTVTLLLGARQDSGSVKTIAMSNVIAVKVD